MFLYVLFSSSNVHLKDSFVLFATEIVAVVSLCACLSWSHDGLASLGQNESVGPDICITNLLGKVILLHWWQRSALRLVVLAVFFLTRWFLATSVISSDSSSS